MTGASWRYIASTCWMAFCAIKRERQAPTFLQIPSSYSTASDSVFTFPLLWHFCCYNQRPFPFGLSTVEMENSCSATLWIIGALCTSCHQAVQVTFSAWAGHRGELWSWKEPQSSSIPTFTHGRSPILSFPPTGHPSPSAHTLPAQGLLTPRAAHVLLRSLDLLEILFSYLTGTCL